MQIQAFLELGQQQKIIRYRLHTATTDDDRIVDTDEAPPVIERAGSRLKKVTPEIETYICKLHIEKGMDRYEIAKELRIHPETVRKIHGKFGLNKELRKPMDDDDIKEAIRLWTEEQLTATAIGKKLGWSTQTIAKHLQHAGVMARLTPEEVKEKNRDRQSRALRLVHEQNDSSDNMDRSGMGNVSPCHDLCSTSQ